MDSGVELPAPVREAVARSIKDADPDTFTALRLVSRGWQDAADQTVRRLRIRVPADAPQADIPALAKLLRGLGGRFARLEEVHVSDSDCELRPSVSHSLATGSGGRQLSVPGAIWADMLQVSLSASLQAPRAKSVSCFARHGFMLLGRDPAWRLDPAAPAEAQAPAVAGMLPAWVPTAPAEDSEDDGDDAAVPAADHDDAATRELHGAQVEGRPVEEGESAAPAIDEQSAQGGEHAVTVGGRQGSELVTLEGSAGPAGPEPAGPEPAVASEVSGGRHVVLASRLWLRVCELDPELPAELLRARVTIHLVAESRVPTSQSAVAGVHGVTAYLPTELDARRDLPVVMRDVFGAFAGGPALRHVWVQFNRQMVWDPPIETILMETRAFELAHLAGLSLWHNCNHLWAEDGDWDQAVVCCTRFKPWTEEAAAAMQDAEKQGLFARRPKEICSLYEAEDDGKGEEEDADDADIAADDMHINDNIEEDTAQHASSA